jgi:hypothetical protein
MTVTPEVADTSPLLKRRTVLIGLAGTVVLAGLPATQAWADDTAFDITAGTDLFDVATTDGPVVQYPRMLGAVLTVRTGTLPAGTRIRLTWDPRVYSPQESPVLTKGPQPFNCHQQGKPTSKKNTAIVIDQDLEAGEPYVLALGAGRQLRYPHDVIDDPTPLKLTLNSSRFTGNREAKPKATSHRTRNTWGAAISVGWEIVTWGDGFHTWLPSGIVVRATGPAAIPKGTRVEVRVDRRVFNSSIVGAKNTHQAPGRAHGEALVAIYAIPQRIPAKSLFVIPVEANISTPTGKIASFEAPTVDLIATTGSSWQRLTGAESAARVDNATDAASRAKYGPQ